MGQRTSKGAVVHVVDDDAGMRTALGRLLQAEGYQVRTYASAGAFLLAEPLEGPACVLLDVRMPGPSGLELQQSLARQETPPPIIFLTGHADIPMTVRALKAGAADFLTKPVQRQTLLLAVEAALAKDAAHRAELTELRSLRARYDTLTAREREVFSRVIAGRLNKQIAADLGAAERTVKAHRARVMEKMQAGSLAELVTLAQRLTLPPRS